VTIVFVGGTFVHIANAQANCSEGFANVARLEVAPDHVEDVSVQLALDIS
jgi:hypothetical protein